MQAMRMKLATLLVAVAGTASATQYPLSSPDALTIDPDSIGTSATGTAAGAMSSDGRTS